MTSGRKPGTAKQAYTDEGRFIRRVWITVIIVAIVVVSLFVVWNASNILLVIFAGGLLAIFLHSISRWIHSQTPLSRRLALFVTLGAILALVAITAWFTAPSIADQAAQLRPALMEAIDALENQFQELPVDPGANGQSSLLEQAMNLGSSLFGRVTSIFSTAAGLLTNLVVLLFVGIYFAYEPGTYVDGLLRLVPEDRRATIREVIEEIVYTLQWWLAGRVAAMLILGTVSVIGLLILDIPLALVLGALVGLFEFIPYLGPVLALVPAVLVAFGQSTSQALYVVALYAGLQIVESYIMTPIIEKRVVSLAPVLLISSQLILGVLFGFWGLLLAPALVVTARVVIKKLYVEDMLGDHSVTYISDEHGDEDE